jgi:hypothetical protein
MDPTARNRQEAIAHFGRGIAGTKSKWRKFHDYGGEVTAVESWRERLVCGPARKSWPIRKGWIRLAVPTAHFCFDSVWQQCGEFGRILCAVVAATIVVGIDIRRGKFSDR